MAKKVMAQIKLQCPGGQANPAPPVGPALGQHGVNIMEFCKQFNAKTQTQQGVVTPVEITVYGDRSFSFITKTPPAAVMLRQAARVEKGSAEPHVEKVGTVTRDQLETRVGARVRRGAPALWDAITPRLDAWFGARD